ncbi:MFS transporter [Nocardia sp. NPDC051756]|uniref:MFS transporter n=1 Tax=Nocardia sp. NPDC051756 TaxID=3154751 RepID=UPI003427437F
MLTTVGLLGLTFLTSSNATIQLATEPAMRGRVMSLHMIVFTGTTPIGAPIIGWVTEEWGPRIGLLACGVVSAGAAVVVGWIMKINSRPDVENVITAPSQGYSGRNGPHNRGGSPPCASSSSSSG